MNPAAKLVILAVLLVITNSFRLGDNFVTFNTSARSGGVSVSVSSNLDTPFTVYSPLLFGNEGSTVTFVPDVVGQKFRFEPMFPEDESRLYNEYSLGEFWYAFKKPVDPQQVDITAKFALTKVTVKNQTKNFIHPLFSLPLSYLNLDNLYRCDDVLISYLNTGSVLDVTVFSEKESWHLFPQTLWGFRQKDREINFSRQTFPLGTSVEVDVGPNKFCVLNDELPRNTYNLVEQKVYTLEDLFVKYSTSLELRDKVKEEQEEEL